MDVDISEGDEEEDMEEDDFHDMEVDESMFMTPRYVKQPAQPTIPPTPPLAPPEA